MSEALKGLSGVFGSVGAMVLTYPLLTVATRQQVKKKRSKSTLFHIHSLIREEGWSQLYAGLSTTLIATAISMGIYTYSYEKLKTQILLRRNKTSLSTVENLLIGYIAGAINTTLTTPLWVIVTRLQAERKFTQQGLFQLLQNIWKDSKLAGFFKGWGASIILCINPAIQWMVFEQSLQLLLKISQKEKANILELFVLGALGKIIATLVTYPYIVMKARLQASNSKISKDDTLSFQYKSMTDGFVQILRNEGFLSLYRGLDSKIIQSVLNSAFLFLFKERIYSLILSSSPSS